jgi:hypothetical protein
VPSSCNIIAVIRSKRFVFGKTSDPKTGYEMYTSEFRMQTLPQKLNLQNKYQSVNDI